MTNTAIGWKQLRALKVPPEVSDEPALCGFLSMVLDYSEMRQTYGGFQQVYSRNDSFSLDRSKIENTIESERMRGSRFSIREIPALALMCRSYDLLLFNSSGDIPFGNMPRNAVSGRTIFAIATLICKHQPGVTTYMLPHGGALHPTLPFKTYSSVRSPFRLGWESKASNYNLVPLMGLITDITLALNSEG